MGAGGFKIGEGIRGITEGVYCCWKASEKSQTLSAGLHSSQGYGGLIMLMLGLQKKYRSFTHRAHGFCRRYMKRLSGGFL